MTRRPTAHLTGPTSLAAARLTGHTPAQLRTTAVHRHSRDVYVPTPYDDRDVPTLLRIAAQVMPEEGAVAGLAAAWWHGMLTRQFTGPVVIVTPPATRRRNRPGIRYSGAQLLDGDTCVVRGLRVTTPLRTAVDLARSLPFTDAVVELDAAARTGAVSLGDLADYAAAGSQLRGMSRVRRVLAAADARAESPMETRLRLLLLQAGLPAPEVQWTVTTSGGLFVARLDLAYPAYRLGVEYDGQHHRDQPTYENDLERLLRLNRVDWQVLRFTAKALFGGPRLLVAEVKAGLLRRAPIAAESNRDTARAAGGDQRV